MRSGRPSANPITGCSQHHRFAPEKRQNPTADDRVLDLKGALLEWCRVGDPDAEAQMSASGFEVRRHPATES